MGQTDRRASDAVRRSSTRRSAAMSLGSARDEDYDLSAIVVADGFRPVESSSSQSPSTTTSHPTIDSRTDTNTETDTDASRSVPHLPPSLADLPSKQHPGLADRPSSISKAYRPHDSLTLRNDGLGGAAVGQSSAAAASRHSNTSPLMRVESPYRGPSGPSHPYQMYPQRTVSSASNSTAGAAADRSLGAAQGPAHPYTLYTQDTTPLEDAQGQHIPIGFHGMGNSYQRQLGPDGEEAGDLIGPLGHLEELPPYTRYPTAAYVRKPPSEPDTAQDRGSPAHAIAGAGGIGMATRNPEFSSTDDDLALARSRPSIRSATSDLSQHEVNTAARDVSEKPAMGKWQRRAKKKMWGIVPYWAICMLVAGLVIMGVVMGSVIGTLLSGHKKGPKPVDDDDEYDTERSSIGIEPLPGIPPGLPAPATGFFSLPYLDASQEPNLCIKDSTQSRAWSCDMPFRSYQVDIERIVGAPETENYELTLTAISPADAKFLWGTQPPTVEEPRALKLVNDTFEQDRGPAWWFNRTYDKTVIVPEETFSAARKRGYTYSDPSLGGFDPHQFSKKSPRAEPGDKPWVCIWPNTTLDVFIYPSENVTYLASSTTSSSIAPATPTAGFDGDDDDDDDGGESSGLPPPAYPSVIKLLDRRLAHGSDSKAVCRQVEISDDGHDADAARDSDGKPIEVTIVEDPSSLTQDDKRFRSRSQSPEVLLPRDALQLTDCGCLWLSQ